ncbi:MAG: type II secretion system F family protein [Pseudomonadota bacterium]
MATYNYRAVTTDGEVREGSLDAASESAAGRRISESGLIVLSISSTAGAPLPAVAGKKAKKPALSLGRKKTFGEAELYLFTRELAALLRAGLPLDSALGVLGEIASQETVKPVIASLRDAIRRGRSLSEAMQAEGHFGRFYVNMVRAGEAGGVLDQVLTRLAEHLERARALRETVVSALIYPAILLSVALISVMVLLVFVVPQFSDLFQDMGKALPLPTRIVIAAGEFLTGYWWLLVALVVGAVVLMRRNLRRPEFRQRVDARLLRLPLFGDLLLKSETVRFTRTFATLLASGVTVAEALSIAGATAQNSVVGDSVGEAAEQVRRGRRISDVLKDVSPFPPLSLHLIRVGEESGDLEGMLEQVAEIFDSEVQSAIKRLLAVLEPALILGLGVLIAGIIISILIAILGMNELAF